MQYLKGSGMNDSEIEKFIPKTLEERRRYVLDKANDLDNMKKDIAYLLSEVSQIREVVSDSMKGVRDTALFEMDHVHKEKRKHKEEELLKENPDFKASSRIPPENRKIRPDSDVEMNA